MSIRWRRSSRADVVEHVIVLDALVASLGAARKGMAQ
jgi:hypothetical protein